MLQVLGRPPAELASSGYHLMECSLPRMAARACFLLEGGRRLPPVLNTLMTKTEVQFIRNAKATQVGHHCLCTRLFWV